MSALRVLVAVVLIATLLRGIQAVESEGCQRVEQFSDTMRHYHDGERWEERCRSCLCDNGQVTCTLKSGFQPCLFYYDPSYDEYCLKWSEDGCCCLRVGCAHQGREYAFGEIYTVHGGSCPHLCACDPLFMVCKIGPC